MDEGINKLNAEIEKKCRKEMTLMDALTEERSLLMQAIDEYVLDNENYEDDSIKITRVQGFRRKWDVMKLEKILPKYLFKNIIKVEVDPAKLDQYVRDGKIDSKVIEPAFEETPNAPYTKWTKRIDKSSAGEKEAESLAGKL